MDQTTSWKTYLWIALFLFLSFMLELFSIFVIEMQLLHVDIGNYTANQRALHSVITMGLWIIVIGVVVPWTRRRYDLPKAATKEQLSKREWTITLLCLAGCKIMTFIDWHTLKMIGEANGKTLLQYLAQYGYYLLEVGLVLLIILYGQKAFETLFQKESHIPYGGLLLAFTWGAFHFVSRGVGIEVWNGISCMIFSVLSGLMYVYARRKLTLSYCLIAIGYLL